MTREARMTNYVARVCSSRSLCSSRERHIGFLHSDLVIPSCFVTRRSPFSPGKLSTEPIISALRNAVVVHAEVQRVIRRMTLRLEHLCNLCCAPPPEIAG